MPKHYTPGKERGQGKLTIRAIRDGRDTNVALPIQIREGDQTLVQLAATGETIPLEVGWYLVTTQLPWGREVSRFINVLDGREVEETIDLRQTGDEPYYASSGFHSMFLSAQATDRRLCDIGTAAARVRSLTFRSNAEGTWTEDWPSNKSLPTHLEFGFYPNERKFVLVERAAEKPIAVALPGYFLLPGLLEFLTVQNDQTLVVKAHTYNRVADWLLAYLRIGAWGSAADLANRIESAAELVRNKREDPIAATIGALVLLRTGRSDDLRGWAKLLHEYRPWLPDARIILAECEARRGGHNDALTMLADLPRNFTPMFADSLRYALDRLGAYFEDPSRFGIDEHQTKGSIASVFHRLRVLSARTDLSEPVLTLHGDDISEVLLRDNS